MYSVTDKRSFGAILDHLFSTANILSWKWDHTRINETTVSAKESTLEIVGVGGENDCFHTIYQLSHLK